VVTWSLLAPFAVGAQEETPPFTDTPLRHWATPAIRRGALIGSFEGLADGTFAGSRLVTRYEFAAAIVRIKDRLLCASFPRVATPPVFRDVPKEHWAFEAVGDVAPTGIFQGVRGGRFAGSKHLTRYEAAHALNRLLIQGGLGLDRRQARYQGAAFSDMPEGHWASIAVEQTAGCGLFEGLPDGRFHGSRPLTCNELAVLIARLLYELQRPCYDLAY